MATSSLSLDSGKQCRQQETLTLYGIDLNGAVLQSSQTWLLQSQGEQIDMLHMKLWILYDDET